MDPPSHKNILHEINNIFQKNKAAFFVGIKKAATGHLGLGQCAQGSPLKSSETFATT
jgi:hypothetical protein